MAANAASCCGTCMTATHHHMKPGTVMTENR